MKYTKLERKLIAELYDKTKNFSYVKEMTGADRKTIKGILKEYGHDIEGDNDNISHQKKYIVAKEMLDDIFLGYSVESIEKRRGISRYEISNLMDYYIRSSLEKIKVNKRKSSNAFKERTEEIIKMIKRGEKTVTEIAVDEGVTVSAISKRIKRYNEKWG